MKKIEANYHSSSLMFIVVLFYFFILGGIWLTNVSSLFNNWKRKQMKAMYKSSKCRYFSIMYLGFVLVCTLDVDQHSMQLEFNSIQQLG
jgi:hypothetical protein